MSQFLRLYHTLRHLRPRQILYQVRQRLRGHRKKYARTQVQRKMGEAVANTPTAKPYNRE